MLVHAPTDKDEAFLTLEDELTFRGVFRLAGVSPHGKTPTYRKKKGYGVRLEASGSAKSACRRGCNWLYLPANTHGLTSPPSL